MPTDSSQSCISSVLLNPAAAAAAEADEGGPALGPSAGAGDGEKLSSAEEESELAGLVACMRATKVRILSASWTISEALACGRECSAGTHHTVFDTFLR